MRSHSLIRRSHTSYPPQRTLPRRRSSSSVTGTRTYNHEGKKLSGTSGDRLLTRRTSHYYPYRLGDRPLIPVFVHLPSNVVPLKPPKIVVIQSRKIPLSIYMEDKSKSSNVGSGSVREFTRPGVQWRFPEKTPGS